MAVVYKARDTRLDRDVAIKVIQVDNFAPAALQRVLKRFEREAKALGRLSHPNIVHVDDYGEHEGIPYLVMDFMRGGTLEPSLGVPIPWQKALRFILPIAEAIEYAHEKHIIHRDIKPSNILLTEKGRPMLSDFGIAKILESDLTTGLTGSGIIGTPQYMAPEQWTGKPVPSSDLYSLGVVLYELVTGRRPYIADKPAALMIKQSTQPLPRPGQFVKGLPGPVEKMLQKTLARNPEDRFADMTTFIGVLDRLLVESPLPKRPIFPPRKEEPDETNEEKQERLQEAARAKREAEVKIRLEQEITRLSEEARAAIRKNDWDKTERLTRELTELGEVGKTAATGLLEQMKERQASQSARELARQQAEEQARLENARRMQELRQRKEQAAAEKARLKAEEAQRKEMAAQQAAQDKIRNAELLLARREASRQQWQTRFEKWNKTLRSRSFWVPMLLGIFFLSAIPLGISAAPGIIKSLSDRSATRSGAALTNMPVLIKVTQKASSTWTSTWTASPTLTVPVPAASALVSPTLPATLTPSRTQLAATNTRQPPTSTSKPPPTNTSKPPPSNTVAPPPTNTVAPPISTTAPPPTSTSPPKPTPTINIRPPTPTP